MIESIGFLIPAFSSGLADTVCTDIQSCRTFSQIISPAITALIAANYLSIHMNILHPDLKWYMKAFESAKVFIVALYFPDWVFVWALRSLIVALAARKRLEHARRVAHDRWAQIYPIASRPSAWKPDQRMIYQFDASYTLAHAFYVIMGGMHLYAEDGRPIRPLDLETTIQLISQGEIQLPSLEAIDGMSKSTYLGQIIADLQLAAFLLKCVLRIVYGLPLAPFEIMAFAHASIAVCTFAPWWYKPMSVDNRTRVPNSLVPLAAAHQRIFPERTGWQVMYAYIFGNQDTLYPAHKLKAVPTFWSGDPSCIFETPQVDLPLPDEPVPAFFIASVGGAILIFIYGLIHLLGCKRGTLATDTEWFLWRWAAIVITAAPWFVTLAYLLGCGIAIHLRKPEWPNHIMLVASTLASAAYIVARITLLVLACTSLRRLPIDVYQTGNLPEYFQ